jgi:hypothetical protein
LSPRVIHLLDQNPRLQDLFEGRGKTAVGEDGRRRDTSSSGFDYSILSALARKGVRDTSELASVLWRRPDGAARAKGIDYIIRTVRKVLADISAGERARDESQSDVIDFTVQRLRVFASNPRKY